MKNTLPKTISERLVSLPEAGMGYQVIRIKTKTGLVFDGVVVIQCEIIASVAGKKEIPFDPADIATFEITNDRKFLVK